MTYEREIDYGLSLSAASLFLELFNPSAFESCTNKPLGCEIKNQCPKTAFYYPKNYYQEKIIFFHGGHCGSDWMGNNMCTNSVYKCAAIYSEWSGCGYFPFASLETMNCARYFESEGCLDDGQHLQYTAYKINSYDGENGLTTVSPNFTPPTMPYPSEECVRGKRVAFDATKYYLQGALTLLAVIIVIRLLMVFVTVTKTERMGIIGSIKKKGRYIVHSKKL